MIKITIEYKNRTENKKTVTLAAKGFGITETNPACLIVFFSEEDYPSLHLPLTEIAGFYVEEMKGDRE